MGKPKVMVVGSGGREHAIVDLFFRSGADVFFNGRNAGASQIAELLPDLDLLTAAEKIQPDLVIFGSEDNLFSGARDELLDKGFNCVGPSKYGARLEGSKMFGRVVSLQAGIPKPAEPTSIQDYTYYLKYEGLAAGKGAHLVENKEHHDVALEFCSSNDRTGEFVLEKVVKGKEFSSFLYCHEGCVFLLGHAADHKRLNQDPQSLMTGGMASISPHPKLDSDMLDGIAIDWGSATLRALADRDIQYEGFLYLGGIASGEAIYLLEYNCRLGDPEAQALLPRLILDDPLDLRSIRRTDKKEKVAALVAATRGYPAEKNMVHISRSSIDALRDQVPLFFGPSVIKEETIEFSGGRILTAGLSSAKEVKIFREFVESEPELTCRFDVLYPGSIKR